jgi:hypothetical protein
VLAAHTVTVEVREANYAYDPADKLVKLDFAFGARSDAPNGCNLWWTVVEEWRPALQSEPAASDFWTNPSYALSPGLSYWDAGAVRAMFVPSFDPYEVRVRGRAKCLSAFADGVERHLAVGSSPWFSVPVGALLPGPPPPPRNQLLTPGVKENLRAGALGAAGPGLLACAGMVASALIPGAQIAIPFFVTTCAALAITAVGTVAMLAIDPPDQRFHEVVEVRPLAVPRRVGRMCPAPRRGAVCSRLRRVARAYLTALTETATVSEALGRTGNRFLTARTAGDQAAMRLQLAVQKVYLGRLAAAYERQERSGSELGNAMRAAKVKLRLRARHRPLANRLFRRAAGRKPTGPRLSGDFDVPASLSYLQRLAGAKGALDLGKMLRTPLPNEELVSEFASLDLNDVLAIATSLAANRSDAVPVRDALAAVSASCSPTIRAERMAAAQAAAATMTGWEGEFLRTALRPAAGTAGTSATGCFG